MGQAAIVGGGAIGGGWAARFLLNGWDVAVFDPDPDAERKIGEVLANARRSLPGLYDRPLPPEGRIAFHAALADAVRSADWVQESVPEALAAKQDVLGEICRHAPAGAIVGSSTPGFRPSQLNEAGARAIVAHAFDPVYLLPLVELAGEAGACARAADMLRGLGMYPLILRKETDAGVADRLMDAFSREALRLVQDGDATTGEIDAAIRMGFGLCWAQTGLFETGRIAGGEERLHDDNLVGILRVLRRTGSGAGGVIAAHDAALPLPRADGLPVTLSRQVPVTWTDYNGHMSSHHYLETGSLATDGFMDLVGADAAYIASGRSFFSVEDHVRYLAEVHAGDRITVTTQVLGAAGKRIHLFHRVHRGDGTLAATMETLLLHTDLALRRSSLPEPRVAAALARWADAHATLDRPEGAGRAVGVKKG